MNTILSIPANHQALADFKIHQLKDDSTPVLIRAQHLEFHRPTIASELAKHFQHRQLNEQQHLFHMTVTYGEATDHSPSLASISAKLDRVYEALLRLTVHRHRFNRLKYRPLHPVVFAFPDAPGSKRKNHNPLPRKTVTDGLHHHCIVAAPDAIADKFYELCDVGPTLNALSINAGKNLALQTDPGETNEREIDRIREWKETSPERLPAPFLKALHIEPIESSIEDITRVVGYDSYHAQGLSKNHPDDWLLIYPKSSAEYRSPSIRI